MSCRSTILTIVSNAMLFSLFGTMYGGDGLTTLGIPDLGDAAPDGITYTICAFGVVPRPN